VRSWPKLLGFIFYTFIKRFNVKIEASIIKFIIYSLLLKIYINTENVGFPMIQWDIPGIYHDRKTVGYPQNLTRRGNRGITPSNIQKYGGVFSVFLIIL
jgi:hypothetical protein